MQLVHCYSMGLMGSRGPLGLKTASILPVTPIDLGEKSGSYYGTVPKHAPPSVDSDIPVGLANFLYGRRGEIPLIGAALLWCAMLAPLL